MLIRLAAALNTTVSALLDNTVPGTEDEEPSIRAIAAKLEALNAESARRSQRNRKLRQAVFSAIAVFALLWFVRECLRLFHIWQSERAMAASSAIIGGADSATSIWVSSNPDFLILLPLLIGLAALFGLYRTRRK